MTEDLSEVPAVEPATARGTLHKMVRLIFYWLCGFADVLVARYARHKISNHFGGGVVEMGNGTLAFLSWERTESVSETGGLPFGTVGMFLSFPAPRFRRLLS